MKVTSEPAPESQVVLTIEIEPAELESSIDSAYRRLASRAVVPGFRKGKAPRQILERYFGRAAVMEDAIEHLAPKVIQEAMDEQQIAAISQPRLEVTQLDPVILKATVDIQPEIELGDYHALRVDVIEPELAEDAIDKTLDGLRDRRATWEPVERPIENDDLVTLDYEAKDGEELLGKSDDLTYRVMPDRKDPLPGFVAELLGLSAGETKQFECSFGEDNEDQDLAGKTVQVSVTVHDVKGKVLPEIDEEFIREVSGDLTSLDDLRERISRNLVSQSEVEAYGKTRDAVLKAFVEQATLEVPFSRTEDEIDTMLRERQELMRRSGLRWEDYVRIIGGSEDGLREQVRSDATERVRRRMLLEALADAETIEATADEINDELADDIRSSGLSAAQASRILDHPTARAISERNIRVRKSLIRLVEIATEGKARPPQDDNGETLIDAATDDDPVAAATEEG
ncbi:MAG: trigger factor [Dehalococcoidia bacterium]